MLRCRTLFLALLAAGFVLAGGPAPALASSIVSESMINGVDTIVPDGTPGSTKYAYYSLVNTQSTPINSLVVALVDPSGTVVVGSDGSPMTVVGGSSGFIGALPGQAKLSGLASGPGVNPQGFALDFSDEANFVPPYNNPFAPGGVANFKLSLASDYASTAAPTLTLQDPYANLSLTSYTPPFANAGATPTFTPEPASLALWSALAGAAVLRARAFRRARALARHVA